MKAKAVVSKVNVEQGTMVVFTRDRQFLRLDLPRDIPALGTTVEIDIPSRRKRFNYRTATWAAAAAVVLLVFALSIFVGTVPPVAAYVNLNMKSGFQLAVTNEGSVKEVTAADIEGEKLLTGLELKNKNVYQALQDLVSKASASGYFDSSSENLVMASVADLRSSGSSSIDKEKVRDIIFEELSSHHYPGYVVVNGVDKEYWEEAREKGYTVNQSILLERAEQHGLDIQGEELHHDVIEAVRNSKVPVTTLFPEESHRVTWTETEARKDHLPADTNHRETSTPAGKDDHRNYTSDKGHSAGDSMQSPSDGPDHASMETEAHTQKADKFTSGESADNYTAGESFEEHMNGSENLNHKNTGREH